MLVVVIGLGQVGRHVVRTLEWERHDLVAVDNSPEAITFADEHFDVQTLLGYGASQAVLREAKAGEADLVVAVSNHDEVNLIAALAARQMGAKRVIARVEGRDWSGTGNEDGVVYGLLGVDVVFNPQVLLAQEIAKIARSYGALEVIDLANDRVELVQMELTEDARVLHKPLSKLVLPKGVLVAAVVRDGDLFVPGGADVLLPGDRAYLIGLADKVMQAEELFTRTREARQVCIVGGGVVGEYLAKLLSESGASVMLIEKRLERAQRIGADLSKVTVVHGDGTDLQLLEEEGVGQVDLFVAVTQEDEVNLMAALLAKRVGQTRTCTLVHRADYMTIYRQLGIDIVLSPRTVASDHILRFCRTTEIKALSVIENGKAEVIELLTPESSRAVGIPLRRLNMPRGSILAAILKGDQVIIPGGDDVIDAGDTVIVLTTTAARSSVDRLFRPRAF